MSSKHTASHFVGAGSHRNPTLEKGQNFVLIWLDNYINKSNRDHQSAIDLFHSVIENVEIFTDENACIKFIRSTSDTKKICMVVSGSIGQTIVTNVHDMPQMNSIFVFCENKQRHEQWAQKWPKIRGVMTDPQSICTAVKTIVWQSDQSTAPSSITPMKKNKHLNQLDSSFMCTQVLKEILLTIHFDGKDIKEFTDYCRQRFVDNAHDLENIERFEEEYRDHPPIWWYTCEWFLPRVLNDALQKVDMDALTKMRFFIADLHREIGGLYTKQSNEHHLKYPFEVYCGQGMSKADWAQLKQKCGGLMAFNNFLSTNRDQQASLKTAYHATEKAHPVGILFIIKVHPSRSTVPFASVAENAYYSNCNEILFSMHAVFRIEDIRPMDKTERIVQVTMTLTNDTDDDLRVRTDSLREELNGYPNGWHRLAQLLSKTDHSSQAKRLLKVLSEQSTVDTGNDLSYEQRGAAKFKQGDYKSALEFYQKALEVDLQTAPSDSLKLARSYGNVGDVYRSLKDYKKALSFHEKALAIHQQSLAHHDPILEKCRKTVEDIRKKLHL